ncbi:hypothetical protein BDR03DRAFT_938091 [Suillus americanus]|nr:hypothetical protein BDR03DRAFT_938091 [Suillus americanus]
MPWLHWGIELVPSQSHSCSLSLSLFLLLAPHHEHLHVLILFKSSAFVASPWLGILAHSTSERSGDQDAAEGWDRDTKATGHLRSSRRLRVRGWRRGHRHKEGRQYLSLSRGGLSNLETQTRPTFEPQSFRLTSKTYAIQGSERPTMLESQERSLIMWKGPARITGSISQS